MCVCMVGGDGDGGSRGSGVREAVREAVSLYWLNGGRDSSQCGQTDTGWRPVAQCPERIFFPPPLEKIF